MSSGYDPDYMDPKSCYQMIWVLYITGLFTYFTDIRVIFKSRNHNNLEMIRMKDHDHMITLWENTF